MGNIASPCAVDDASGQVSSVFCVRAFRGNLPVELDYGSVMTSWRCLRDRQAASVWHRLHQGLLELHCDRKLDLSRASLDAASVAFPGRRLNRAKPD